MNDAGEGNSGF